MTPRLPILMLTMLLLGGCAKSALPTYEWTDHAGALRTVSRRDAELRSLSARCLLTLESTQGSVRLESALAMQRRGLLRLRAWKFSQAVFDLTMNDDGVHVMAPQQPSRPEASLTARASAGQIARAWGVFTGDLFDAENLVVQDAGGPTFAVRRALDEQMSVVCTIDRRTLTPRRYELLDAQGDTRFTLSLDRYHAFGNVVFPTRLAGEGPDGSFVAELDEVEVNIAHPPGTFAPPARAERLQ